MLPSLGGRRGVFLLRRAAATAAGGANRFRPQPQLQPHAACFTHRFFSTTHAARARDSEYSHTTASYLIASWGLSPAAAAAVASRGIRILSTAKADAILALLRHHGFSDADIALLISKEPKLLRVDPDKILRPKLEFFASLGVEAGWLARAHILRHSLNKYIIPRVEFLRGILGTDAFRVAFSRHPFALMIDFERSTCALQALRHHGLSGALISKLMVLGTGVLRISPDRIAAIFEDLEALGISASDSCIVYCFHAMAGVTKKVWLRKMELYRSLGVPEGELLRAFKRYPWIMMMSGENIKRKTCFFLDELKLDLSYVVLRRPLVLLRSLEKCIIPRCAVLSMLMREGKIKRDINILRPLHITSKVFLKQYVLRYAGSVPDVVGAYEGKIKFEGFEFEDRMSRSTGP